MIDKSFNFENLVAAWGLRCSKIAEGDKLYAEGHKLRAEGHKLWNEGSKLWNEGSKLCTEGRKLYAEGRKLYAEGDKLCAEGSKLRFEGDKLWDSAVVSVLGPLNSKQIWMCDNTICLLTDGSMWKVPE